MRAIQTKDKKLGKLFFFGGVILPILAVLFETTTHFCARNFFDPFPSPSHVILVLLIPLANFMAWLTQHKDISQHYGFMALATGMAAGVGIMYSLMFLPILGLSLLFSIAGGFGLLGLAPTLSLPCTFMSGRRVSKLALSKGTFFDAHQVQHIGHLIILVMVVAIELPSTLTRVHLDMADNPKTAAEGLKWLRKYGSQEVMLRACYERSGRATDILGSLYESARPLQINNARTIFYRVTGKPFNSVPLPAAARATIRHAGLADDVAGVNAAVEDEFDLDTDIAGEVISGVSRGLSVNESSINVILDPDAMLGNMEWSILLNNTSKYDREARAKLLLPRGAFVRGAVLTMDGADRQAKIMVRGKARYRYVQSAKSSHTVHKDPLLISTCGPDEVLVQCFPVKPDSTLRLKLSLVCPLVFDENGKATLGLPTIVEKNFQFDSPVKIDVASTHSLSSSAGELVVTKDDKEKYGLSGSCKPDSLSAFKVFVHADRDKTCERVFCHDQFDPNRTVVERKIMLLHFAAPKKLEIVVDGSKIMRDYLPEIEMALKALPADLSVDLTVVGDDTKRLCKSMSPADPKFAEAVDTLKKFDFIAGQDDSVELLESVKRSCASTESAVLWIHAAQPVHRASDAVLARLLRSAGARPILYDMLVLAGPDEMLEGLSSCRSLVRVPRSGSISDDLLSLYKDWQTPTAPGSEFAHHPVEDLGSIDVGQETNSSLAQLCAYRQILDEPNPDSDRSKDLARDYNLVSPVSSAIVTINYPSREQTIDTAVSPEADTWLLMIVAAALMTLGIVDQKRRRRLVKT